jgi:polyribonucleotide nucleotidyltransferase
MDIKCSGLNREIMEKVLQRSREARLRVLDEMRKAISEARKELSHYAPRIYTLFINSDRVKDLIGPGGKNIKAIIQKTNTQIDIDNDGKVSITATDEKSAEEAIMLVKSYTEPPEVGKVYLGSVVKTVEFGAFIRIMPGVEGLCHISELSDKRVRSVEDVVREGDQVLVRVIEIDRFGQIRLSRKNALGEKHG